MKCDPQYKLNNFVTMATYWVPGLTNIKGFSVQIGVLICYLQMAPHMHDPSSIWIC